MRVALRFIPEHPDWRWVKARAVVCLIAAGSLCWVMQEKLVIAQTASVGHWLFYQSTRRPEHWDYARFTRLDPVLSEQPVVLIKRLRCGPGDQLERREDGFYCNGVFLGQAKTHGLKGQVLPVFTHQGPVPQGRWFVLGEHTDSYDSRYYGLIPAEQLKTLVALW